MVLDPRTSIEEAVAAATDHSANLLLAEVIGAAVHHRAAIRLTPANLGKTWRGVMDRQGIDFATIEP